MLHGKSKTRNQILILWAVTFLCLYYIFSKRSELESYHDVDNNSIPHLVIDAIVYVAMGKIAGDITLDYSLLSLRKLGNYQGDVYIITDSPQCFETLAQKDSLKIIEIPSIPSIIKIKSLKTHLLSYLPENKRTILYLDVDILVSKPLYSFIHDTNKVLQKHIKMKKKESEPIVASSSSMSSNIVKKYNSSNIYQYPIDMAAFYDSIGHYIGFCSGCEKWHSGVLIFQRNAPVNKSDQSLKANSNHERSECLIAWEQILLSGKLI